MSGLNIFLKENKKVRQNFKVAATQSIKDEEGNAVEFEFKPLTTKQNDSLRDACTTEIPVPGKKGQYKTTFDRSKYMAMVLAETCVYPNLRSAELQDSYGVKTPEALIQELVDDPGEYNALFEAVALNNGFTEEDNKVEQVKN